MSGVSLNTIAQAAVSMVVEKMPSLSKMAVAGMTALAVRYFQDSTLQGMLAGAVVLGVCKFFSDSSAAMPTSTIPVTPQNFAEEVEFLCQQVGSYKLNSANKDKAIARFNEIVKVVGLDTNSEKIAVERCNALKNYLEKGTISVVMLPFLTGGLIKAYSWELIPKDSILNQYNTLIQFSKKNQNNLGENAGLIANNLQEVSRLLRGLPKTLESASPAASNPPAARSIPPLPVRASQAAASGASASMPVPIPVPASSPGSPNSGPRRRGVSSGSAGASIAPAIPLRALGIAVPGSTPSTGTLRSGAASPEPLPRPAPLMPPTVLPQAPVQNEPDSPPGVDDSNDEFVDAREPLEPEITPVVQLFYPQPPDASGVGSGSAAAVVAAAVSVRPQPAPALRTDLSVFPAARKPDTAPSSRSIGGAAHPASAPNASPAAVHRKKPYETAAFDRDVAYAEARARELIPKTGTQVDINGTPAIIDARGIAVVQPRSEMPAAAFASATSATTPSHAFAALGLLDLEPKIAASDASAAPKKARELHVQPLGLFD